jgi:hypothetical protein
VLGDVAIQRVLVLIVVQLNRDLVHENVTALREVIFNDEAIFQYAELEFLVSTLLNPHYLVVC